MHDPVRDLVISFVAESTEAQRFAYHAGLTAVQRDLERSTLFHDLAEELSFAAHGHLDLLRALAPALDGSRFGHLGHSPLSIEECALDASPQSYEARAESASRNGLDDVASWFLALAALKRDHYQRIGATTGTSQAAENNGHESPGHRGE